MGRIHHHGRLVAPAEALEPVNDHCFLVSNCPFTASQNKCCKSYWCRKVSDTSQPCSHYGYQLLSFAYLHSNATWMATSILISTGMSCFSMVFADR